MRIAPGEVRHHIGEAIRTSGWVEVVRDQKAMQFVIIGDRSGSLQLAIHRKSQPELAETVASLVPGSTIEVHGTVLDDARVKLGGVEVAVTKMTVLSMAIPSPIDEDSSPDLQIEYRHLSLRQPRQRLIAEVGTTLQLALRQWLLDRDYIEIQTPKLMPAASESGASVFEVDYFERKAYLAQSPQFYKQMAMLGGMDRIFEWGPVFRAEQSFSSRHLTEFVSVDVEVAWIDGVEDVMQLEETWLAYALGVVKDRHGDDIQSLFGVDVVVPETPFPRISFVDTLAWLADSGFELTNDLNDEAERELGRLVKERYGHEFVFVHSWPTTARPFYHMRDGELTNSYDLIWRGLEITTGAQREHRHDVLVDQAQEHGLGDSVQSYLDSFRHGAPPHGGFGFGLARVLMLLTGQSSVRDTVFLPRTPSRLEP